MKLRVLAVGKLKDRGLESLEDDYLKRLAKMLPTSVESLRNQEALLARASRPRVIMDERGKQPSSTELAEWIGAWQERGEAQVDFLIGDAHGFSEDDRKDADRVFSLSRLTLPHRLARIVLVEQLYRAATILAGHPYHHA